MASITPVTRPSNRKDGRRPVYIRIHHDYQTRYLSLGIHVAESHFDSDRGEVRRSHPKHRELNRIILEAREAAEDALYEARQENYSASAEEIRDRAQAILEPEKKEEEDCFIAYSEKLLENWRGRWSHSTKVNYETALNHLISWAGKPLPFSEVTPKLCRSFLAHLLGALGHKNNTAYKNIAALKSFYSYALDEGVVEWKRNPFSAAKITTEVTKKEKLTTEELCAIKDLELEDEDLREVRDLFLFSFYSGGMRFSDVLQLKVENVLQEPTGLKVRYVMTKSQKEHEAYLPEEAEEILRRYRWEEKGEGDWIFPILGRFKEGQVERLGHAPPYVNEFVNERLKELAERAGVEKRVSFHLARHSVAGRLLEKGYNTRDIQEVLGHSSVVVTERYLEGFESEGSSQAAEDLRI